MSRIKIARLVLIAITIVTVTWGGFIAAQSLGEPFLSTESSDGQLNIQFFERQEFPFPFSDRRVTFVVHNNKTGLELTGILMSFESNTLGFQQRFPTVTWIGNSVLRFSPSSRNATDDTDELTIRNKTSSTLNHIVLSSLDEFIVVGLLPGDKKLLKIPHYRWQSWIEAHGKFDDGTNFPANGMNFSHNDKIPGPLRYCVTITREETVVQSLAIAGWRSDGINIPVAKNCD